MKTVSKIYLWLIPALSVPVLFVIKNNSNLIVYLAAVTLHLLLITLAVSRFNAAHDLGLGRAIRFAAILLIFGATCTFISATTFPTTNLEAISSNLFEHYWTSAGFFISELIFLLGMNTLNRILKQSGIYSQKFGFMAMLIGGILWFVHLSFRLTIMVWAADHKQTTGTIPGYYETAELWAGGLYAAYMVMTYAGFIAFGVALNQSSLTPKWLSKLTIIFGIVTPLMFVTGIGPFRMPIAIQIMPWLIGIILIDSQSTKKELSKH